MQSDCTRICRSEFLLREFHAPEVIAVPPRLWTFVTCNNTTLGTKRLRVPVMCILQNLAQAADKILARSGTSSVQIII